VRREISILYYSRVNRPPTAPRLTHFTADVRLSDLSPRTFSSLLIRRAISEVPKLPRFPRHSTSPVSQGKDGLKTLLFHLDRLKNIKMFPSSGVPLGPSQPIGLRRHPSATENERGAATSGAPPQGKTVALPQVTFFPQVRFCGFKSRRRQTAAPG